MSRTNRTVALLLLPLASFAVPACADDQQDDQQTAVQPPETEASAEIADQGRPDPAHPSACGQVDEFARPEGVAALDIVAGSDGNLWFASSDALGRVSPRDGSVTLVPIPSSPLQGRLAAGPDGNIWFLTSTGVASFSPRRHTVRDIPIPDLVYGQDLVAGPDGAIRVLASLNVVRVTVHGQATAFSLPVESLNGSHIAPGSDGNVWFTGAASKACRLSTGSPGTASSRGSRWTARLRLRAGRGLRRRGVVHAERRRPEREQHRPDDHRRGRVDRRSAARQHVASVLGSQRHAHRDRAGPGDSMVFTTYLVEPLNYIGSVNRHGKLTRFEVPTPGAASFGITTGPDGNVWFTENFNPLIGRVNLAACHHHRGPGGHR